MTDKDIKLETNYGESPPTIDAPCAVAIKKNSKLKWNNDLDKVGGRPNQGEEATIKLYEVTDTGNVPIPADAFCEGYLGGDLLIIPGRDQQGDGDPGDGQPSKGKYNCKVIFEGEFKYDVTATGHQPLDPIIIVQPPPVGLIYQNLATLLAAIIFAGLGYYFGFRKRSNQA